MAYSGGLTREQFMFSEMRITARLKLEGMSDQEILEKVYRENLFQYPTEKELKSKCKACLKRLKAIENMPAVMDHTICIEDVEDYLTDEKIDLKKSAPGRKIGFA